MKPFRSAAIAAIALVASTGFAVAQNQEDHAVHHEAQATAPTPPAPQGGMPTQGEDDDQDQAGMMGPGMMGPGMMGGGMAPMMRMMQGMTEMMQGMMQMMQASNQPVARPGIMPGAMKAMEGPVKALWDSLSAEQRRKAEDLMSGPMGMMGRM